MLSIRLVLRLEEKEMKVAIVDDNKEIAEQIERILFEVMHEYRINMEIDIYTSALNLLYEMKDGKHFELFLLDIEMPDMTGIDLAKEIRGMLKHAYIIFVTSHTEYAIKGYEVNAFRYVTKNSMEKELEDIIFDIYKKIMKEKDEVYFIETQSRFEKLYYRDMIYITKQDKNTVFVMEYGEVKVRKPIGIVFDEIKSPAFIYVNKGIIINIRKVVSLKKGVLLMEGGAELQVSRIHIKAVKEKIGDYWRDMI